MLMFDTMTLPFYVQYCFAIDRVDVGATGVENCENQWRRWAPEDLAAPAVVGGM